MIRSIRQRQLTVLQEKYPIAVVIQYPPQDRERIAVELARTLTQRDGSEGIAPAQWSQFVGTKWQYRLPPACGIKEYAVEILSSLTDPELTIHTPAVLPYLIAALDHPNQERIGRGAFSTLLHMTAHTTGEDYWTQTLPGDPERHRVVVDWWRRWWKENAHNHPVCDADLKARVQQKLQRLAKSLKKELKGRYREMAAFRLEESTLFQSAPDNRRGSGFVALVYCPGSEFRGSAPQNLDQCLCRLSLSTNLRTSDLPAPGERPVASADAWSALKTQAQIVYTVCVPGTGVEIRLELATRNPDFLQAVRKVMARAGAEAGLKRGT